MSSCKSETRGIDGVENEDLAAYLSNEFEQLDQCRVEQIVPALVDLERVDDGLKEIAANNGQVILFIFETDDLA